MRAMKIVLIQHVVTQRHVDLTKTHITFYRIHQHVSEEEDESSGDDERARLEKQLADDTRWLEEEIARLESSRPPPQLPSAPAPQLPSASPIEIEPPLPPKAVGETFRQRLARIAEEETQKLIAKK
jgi:hypothetical protein